MEKLHDISHRRQIRSSRTICLEHLQDLTSLPGDLLIVVVADVFSCLGVCAGGDVESFDEDGGGDLVAVVNRPLVHLTHGTCKRFQSLV